MKTTKTDPFLMTHAGAAYLTLTTEDAAQIVDALARYLGEERLEVLPPPNMPPHADWVAFRVPAKKHAEARAFIAGTEYMRGATYADLRGYAVREARRRVHEGGTVAPHTDLDPSGVPEGPTRSAAPWIITHSLGFRVLVEREQRERVCIETASLMGAIFREGRQGLLAEGWYTAGSEKRPRKGPYDSAREAWIASLP